MDKKKEFVSPGIRLIRMDLEGHFCYSPGNVGVATGSGSAGCRPEDVGYDNWLDSLE